MLGVRAKLLELVRLHSQSQSYSQTVRVRLLELVHQRLLELYWVYSSSTARLLDSSSFLPSIDVVTQLVLVMLDVNQQMHTDEPDRMRGGLGHFAQLRKNKSSHHQIRFPVWFPACSGERGFLEKREHLILIMEIHIYAQWSVRSIGLRREVQLHFQTTSHTDLLTTRVVSQQLPRGAVAITGTSGTTT